MKQRGTEKIFKADTFVKLFTGLTSPKALKILVCIFISLYLTVYVDLYVLAFGWLRLPVLGFLLVIFGFLSVFASRLIKAALRPRTVLLAIAAAVLFLAGCKNVFFPPRQKIDLSLTAETAGEICLCDVVIDGENIPVGQAQVVENTGWLYREQWDNFVIWPEEDGTRNRLTMRFFAKEVHLGFPYTPYAGSVAIESSAGESGTWDLRCPEWAEGEEVQYADISFNRPACSQLELLLYGIGVLSIISLLCLYLRKPMEVFIKWLIMRKDLLSGLNIWLAVYAFLLSCTLVVGGKMNMEGSPYFQPFVSMDILKLAVLFLAFLSVGCILLKIINGKRLIEIQAERISVKWWLCAWLLLVVLWIPYLLAYYPGTLSPDSFTSLLQVKNLKLLYNHIPIAYTLLIALFARIGWAARDANFGIFLFTIVQTLIMGGVLSYSAYWIRKKVRYPIAAFAVLLFYGLNPIVALYSMTMWKDVLYSAWIVLLCLFLFDMAMGRGEELGERKRLVQLGVLFVLTAFGRNNGIYVVLFCWLVLLLIYRKARRKLFAAGGGVILSILLIQGPGYKILGIDQAGFAESVGIPLQQVCYTVVTDGLPEGGERGFLEKIIPIETIEESYSPVSADNIKFNPEFDTAFFEQNKPGFIRLYIKLLPSHFKAYVQSYLLSTSGFWHPQTISWVTEEHIYENDMGIYNVDYFLKLFHYDWKASVSRKITFLKNSPLANVGLMVWFVFFYIVSCLAQKQSWKAVLSLPLVGCWLTLMIATPVNAQFRYVYYYHLMLPVVAILFFIKRENK